MRGSSFGYLIRVGIKSVFKNRLMSFAAIGVLVACLLLIGMAGLLSLNVNSIIGYLEDQNEVIVFVQDGASGQDIENLDLDLHSVDNIIEVTLIPKEETLESYKERLGEDGGLLDYFDDDIPFPDAFQVRVDSLARLDDTIQTISGLDNVLKVNAPTDIAATIVSIQQAVYIGGASIVIILAVVALIIIANTIKITVFNRRKEINIMKFVGATDTFIRLPFIVEGMMLGLLSATIAFFILWGGYEYLLSWMIGSQSSLFTMFREQVIPFMDIAVLLFGSFAGAGIFIGVGGSMIFVRKYLKV
ncbi:MAG: ABC transporter permease [Provencibacterium sp.]|jgi:cell division transport system permease protein|nr:ABC transporter permease [Provencibacterium sp.]